MSSITKSTEGGIVIEYIYIYIWKAVQMIKVTLTINKDIHQTTTMNSLKILLNLLIFFYVKNNNEQIKITVSTYRVYNILFSAD